MYSCWSEARMKYQYNEPYAALLTAWSNSHYVLCRRYSLLSPNVCSLKIRMLNNINHKTNKKVIIKLPNYKVFHLLCNGYLEDFQVFMWFDFTQHCSIQYIHSQNYFKENHIGMYIKLLATSIGAQKKNCEALFYYREMITFVPHPLPAHILGLPFTNST